MSLLYLSESVDTPYILSLLFYHSICLSFSLCIYHSVNFLSIYLIFYLFPSVQIHKLNLNLKYIFNSILNGVDRLVDVYLGGSAIFLKQFKIRLYHLSTD